MSKEIMADCLQEARGLWEALMNEGMIEVDEGERFYSWTREIAITAAALYPERCKQEATPAHGELVEPLSGNWTCAACGLPWAGNHLCPTAAVGPCLDAGRASVVCSKEKVKGAQ